MTTAAPSNSHTVRELIDPLVESFEDHLVEELEQHRDEMLVSERSQSTPATPPDRVAVVLVHGIGEQRPMSTLRDFAGEYKKTRTPQTMWSVADRFDRTFELHSYVLPPQDGVPTEKREAEKLGLSQVDLYEGYWAKQIRGTKLAHLRPWALHVVGHARKGSLPLRLMWVWLPLLVLTVAAIGFAIWFLIGVGEDSPWFQAVKVVCVIAAPPIGARLSGSLGDAARYLDNSVENIAARFEVRKEIVTLLDELHDSGRYRKIVLIGHSLGGVVAYDALRLLWARRTRGWDASHVDDAGLLEAARRLTTDDSLKSDSLKNYTKQQARLFADLSKPKGDTPAVWLISDLVTVGSPIAYPEMLMTPPGVELGELITEREMPTCPPQPADNGSGESSAAGYRYDSWPHPGGDPIKVFHHAAMFAATKWTNIYALADFVGGPIPPELGRGVVDTRIGNDSRKWPPSWERVPFSSHTKYWKKSSGQEAIWRVINQAAQRG